MCRIGGCLSSTLPALSAALGHIGLMIGGEVALAQRLDAGTAHQPHAHLKKPSEGKDGQQANGSVLFHDQRPIGEAKQHQRTEEIPEIADAEANGVEDPIPGGDVDEEAQLENEDEPMEGQDERHEKRKHRCTQCIPIPKRWRYESEAVT